MSVFQSRWGYHAVNKEDFLKIKFINKVAQKARTRFAAWERWSRKFPENRILRRTIRDEKGLKIGREPVLDENGKPKFIPEPVICPLFLTKKWGFNRFDDMGIFALYAQVRHPVSSPELVTPLTIPLEKINELYYKAKYWWETEIEHVCVDDFTSVV